MRGLCDDCGGVCGIFRGESLGRIRGAVCGGADPGDVVRVRGDSYEGDLLKYPLLPDLRHCVYSRMLYRTWAACGDDHDREYHAAYSGCSDDELVQGFYQRGHDQRTSSFLGGDDHGGLCGGRVYHV